MDELPYVTPRGIVYKYGEFFPIELSPFAYNETVAQELELLSQEAILEKGYAFQSQEVKKYSITTEAGLLPETIEAVTEDIMKEVISCAHTGLCTHGCATAFRITKEEWEFYKRMNIPLPHLCSNCRHYERIAYRNPFTLWHRSCMCEAVNHGHAGKCLTEFQTSYNPKKPEIVYCETCYQQEVA